MHGGRGRLSPRDELKGDGFRKVWGGQRMVVAIYLRCAVGRDRRIDEDLLW